jgi:hypothetical protein
MAFAFVIDAIIARVATPIIYLSEPPQTTHMIEIEKGERRSVIAVDHIFIPN